MEGLDDKASNRDIVAMHQRTCADPRPFTVHRAYQTEISMTLSRKNVCLVVLLNTENHENTENLVILHVESRPNKLTSALLAFFS